MSEETTLCPDCGQTSPDTEWCDNCGAALNQSPGAEESSWLVTTETLDIESDRGPLTLRIDDPIENFATRKVFTAMVVEPEDSELLGEMLFVEESQDDGRSSGSIPADLESLFRRPFFSGRHGEHTLEIYRDVGGMTCEDLVDISNGQLTYLQIKDVFEAVSQSVMKCHNEGQMLLAVAPWTVRIEGLSENFISTDTKPNHLSFSDGNITPAPPNSRLDGDTTQVDGLFATANREEQLETLEDVSPDTVDIAALETLTSEAEIDEISVEIDGIEDSPAMDAWDIFEEDPDSSDLGATGILPGATRISVDTVDLHATFEGLDRTYPEGVNPEEVPVIMGFSAPELLGRVRADVSTACDVFGLGMLLHFLLAGKVPPSSVYTRYSPALPARNFRPGFSPGLQPIITRATRPNPEERYPSVQAMLDAFFGACDLMELRAGHVGTDEPPRFRMAVDTHIGIAKARRNPTNQDSVFGRFSDDGRFGLVVIADGVSTASYGSGDLASKYLEQRASEIWDEILPAYLMDERLDEINIILDLLARSNTDIVDHVNVHFTPFSGNPHEVMGTTALCAILHDGIVTLGSLGDSRVYLQNSAGLEQITIDHNLWSLSILDGVPPDTALAMPHGDALAKCLGTFSIREGRLTAIQPDPDFFRFTVTRGDSLLFTSDGLIDFAGANSHAAEENVLAVMLSEPDPALACLELILLANRGGGGDNIGVGIAQFF